MLPNKRANHAVYIEGLPMECVETDLIKLLQPCGKVTSVSMHRQPSQSIAPSRPNTVSATVEFQARENAEAAVYLLETSVIWGCRMSARVISPAFNSAAPSGNSNGNSGSNTKALRSAQVHISYLTKQLATIVTEQMIFELFSTFGKVIEVSLKKKCVDTEMCIQNGYGFVHYPLTSEGIDSALRAVETLHQVTINNISYDCSVSNQLKQVLVSSGRIRDHGPASSAVSIASGQSGGSGGSGSLMRPQSSGIHNRSWWEESQSSADSMNFAGPKEDRLPPLINSRHGQVNNGSKDLMDYSAKMSPNLCFGGLSLGFGDRWSSADAKSTPTNSIFEEKYQPDSQSVGRFSLNSFTSGKTSHQTPSLDTGYKSGQPDDYYGPRSQQSLNMNTSVASGRSSNSGHSSVSSGWKSSESGMRTQRSYQVPNVPLIAEEDNFAYPAPTLETPSGNPSNKFAGVLSGKWF